MAAKLLHADGVEVHKTRPSGFFTTEVLSPLLLQLRAGADRRAPFLYTRRPGPARSTLSAGRGRSARPGWARSRRGCRRERPAGGGYYCDPGKTEPVLKKTDPGLGEARHS